MPVTDSIFLDIQLPNAPTWFYFSGLLAVALFFKFSRLLSIRNLDVLALLLPMPGFLLLMETKTLETKVLEAKVLESKGQTAPLDVDLSQVQQHARWAYLRLLAVTGYWTARCLFDLTL